MLLTPAIVFSQGLVTTNPYKVQAAYLRNFAHYVSWPSSAFSENSSVWHIGILGPDPFGAVLDTTLEGRTEQGLPFVVYRAGRLKDLPPCQIIYISFKEAGRRRAALSALRDRPVLTVGEAADFLSDGGVIRFDVDGRVTMGVNLDQARKVQLNIQTKMLEVSRVIVENGVTHRKR